MLKRPGQENSNMESTNLKKAMDLCFKFNCILHEALELQQDEVLSIKSCTSLRHFDGMGNLSSSGMIAFWHEVDDLLERFDRGKVKLLPKLHRISMHNQQGYSPRDHHASHHHGPTKHRYWFQRLRDFGANVTVNFIQIFNFQFSYWQHRAKEA